ncbi:hypothetical protein MKW98_026284 [Papaver atlanticum]|uniref:Uncharacterized protein n=1 Tax=Papaver atlanticum TaxID=357466 RepID=A0AAD4XJ23_9MAGN|nr:hypothetical protein MKW98_026284 [Papaver atlanticum]
MLFSSACSGLADCTEHTRGFMLQCTAKMDHITHNFRLNENYVTLCWITLDFELYAAFDPLADKALAIKMCNAYVSGLEIWKMRFYCCGQTRSHGDCFLFHTCVCT